MTEGQTNEQGTSSRDGKTEVKPKELSDLGAKRRRVEVVHPKMMCPDR